MFLQDSAVSPQLTQHMNYICYSFTCSVSLHHSLCLSVFIITCQPKRGVFFVQTDVIQHGSWTTDHMICRMHRFSLGQGDKKWKVNDALGQTYVQVYGLFGPKLTLDQHFSQPQKHLCLPEGHLCQPKSHFGLPKGCLEDSKGHLSQPEEHIAN